MFSIDVLIGSNQPLYSEVLASTFQAMRPDLRVRSTPEGDLDALVCELRPMVVICSMVSPTISDCSSIWIRLYPEDRDEALVSIRGVQQTIPGATVGELLQLIDIIRSSFLYDKDDRHPSSRDESLI
jgi:hypothetical protein